MKVEKHISRLLFEYDCVIIPHFGGFVGNYKSAKLDRLQNKFIPPYKEISFNRNLTHNDGLLANRIAIEENKDYEEVNSFLKKYSDDLKLSLKQEKKVEFEQIGILFSDEHQNIRFEPDYSTNYLMDSFGLSSFHSSLIIKPELPKITSLREKSEIKFTDRPAINIGLAETEKGKKVISVKRTRKYFRYSAITLSLLLLILFIPFSYEKLSHLGKKTTSLNYSSLLTIFDKPAPVYSLRTENQNSGTHISHFIFQNQLSSIHDSVAFTSFYLFENSDPEFSENNKIIVKLKEPIVEQKLINNSKTENRGRFHIIGGCFQYLENAQKFVEKLHKKGFNAAIVDKHKGLYRVCFQSFTSRNDALNLLAMVKSSSNNNAWLLIK